MKKAVLLTGLLLAGGLAAAQTIRSPNQKLALTFALTAAGEPSYQLRYGPQTVLKPGRLGLALQDDPGLTRGFEVMRVDSSRHDDTWAPVWGEVKSIRNHYRELAVTLRQPAQQNRQLVLRFRVFDDGLGFRYEVPRQPGSQYFVVQDELTEFGLSADHQAFWIPGDYDTNEYKYTTSPLSQVDNAALVKASTNIAVRVAPDPQAVQTPLMLKAPGGGLYLNIHEAALRDYPALQLHVDRASYVLTARLVPNAVGSKAFLRAPATTPWRTVIVSDNAPAILASKLILNLNEPSKITDTGWITPMKFVGVWWEMQTGQSTWSYAARADTLDAAGQLVPSGRHGATTANVKRYIDFAARHGIGGVLVEGWNVGWEDWFGNWKENVFGFTQAYPDFDVAALSQYAAAKGVKMLMHNETSGAATDYERQLEDAFQFMNKYGYVGVKTGYVGKIVPRGEHHDGQWMVDHYLRTIETAARHRVTIDIHEAVRPTGLHRTYPNFLASEAGRGNEYNAFTDEGNPPEHETILPFTRLMGGPMDYTPGIFKLRGYAAGAPARHLHTTLCKQLALYVTLYSPLQMAADLPENYDAHPDAFQFIKDVPVDWDDTRVLEAEPGQYVTIARQQKGRPNWFVGAITNADARTTTLHLDFLPKGQRYTATVYADAPGADWQTNPEAYRITKSTVRAGQKLRLQLAPGGGAAVSLVAVK